MFCVSLGYIGWHVAGFIQHFCSSPSNVFCLLHCLLCIAELPQSFFSLMFFRQLILIGVVAVILFIVSTVAVRIAKVSTACSMMTTK